MSEGAIFLESGATEAQRSRFGKVRNGAILIAPGVNMPDQSAYAVDAADFAKVLIEGGAVVDWAAPAAEREYMDLKSIEVFLGTLIVAVITETVAVLIADAIVRYLDDRDVRRLNVRIVESETAKSFEADGDAAAVVRALREWKK